VLNLLYLARNDPGQAEQDLVMAEREVVRVARLAQQTLGFVRDSSSPARMDAARIMDEVLELYSRKLESKQIFVTRRYRDSAPISGYAGELRQLLTNLLVNAVDALDPGGSIHVRVQAIRQSSNGQQGVRITLADNGSGIPKESLRRIFEPFYTTKTDCGTGLGLWVSHGIVQKHGGSIRVRSQIAGSHRGTLFSIFLPSVQAASRVA
jgi:two-component system NtrC family sensor kinase